MPNLTWFTTPRLFLAPRDRRRAPRYPAGLSLRATVALLGPTPIAAKRVYSIGAGGVGLVVDQPSAPGTAVLLTLVHADRDFRCSLDGRTAYSVPFRDHFLLGTAFDRPLSLDVLQELTPTLSPWLEVESHGAILVGRFARQDIGEDHAVATIGEQLTSLAENLELRCIALDFQAVRTLNCSILAQLILFRRRVQGQGGRLVLCGMNPLVAQVFETTQLTRLFRIYPTRQAACQSLAGLPDTGV